MDWRRLLLTVKKGDLDVFRIERPHSALSCRALSRHPGARAPEHPLTGSGARGSNAQSCSIDRNNLAVVVIEHTSIRGFSYGTCLKESPC
jgi:hypothetical protein